MKIMPAKTATKMAMMVRPATLAGFLVYAATARPWSTRYWFQ